MFKANLEVGEFCDIIDAGGKFFFCHYGWLTWVVFELVARLCICDNVRVVSK
ncbi:hypothetical protein HanRHA438_Chr03g0108981 [Helianthus annuus]|nr:hypothetical protein HanRHA438_Chr03g0108981 [Helianthus annuus]